MTYERITFLAKHSALGWVIKHPVANLVLGGMAQGTKFLR